VIQITDHLAKIRERVTQASVAAGRSPDDVMLVAVSKGKPAEAIRAAYLDGLRHFGESYAQEAAAKQDVLRDLAITWHFIGKIQANKTRTIAARFDWVHSVNRARIAARLDEQRPARAAPLNVLIQVDQCNEPQKSGVAASEVDALARFVAARERLRLRGLMTIPPAASSRAERESLFRDLYNMGQRLRERGLSIDTWSMGMSEDFELAISQGSNCVRIGTAIFGEREARMRHC
jgi:pyridoxal phosphate enzyme (YggS family)